MIKSLTIAETMSVILNGNSKDTYTEGARFQMTERKAYSIFPLL